MAPKDATAFLDAVKNRRTIYTLSNEPVVSDKRIKEIVEVALDNVPSSFNAQSTRLVVLLKKEHEKLWDLTSEILKPIVPTDMWEFTEGKMKAFRAAYGTVSLFPSLSLSPHLLESLSGFASRNI